MIGDNTTLINTPPASVGNPAAGLAIDPQGNVGASVGTQGNKTFYNTLPSTLPGAAPQTAFVQSPKIPSVKFNVPATNTVDGNHLQPTGGIPSASSAYDQFHADATSQTTTPPAYDTTTGLLTAYGKQQGLPEVNPVPGSTNGTNTPDPVVKTPTPTDAYMQQLFQASQYSPQEIDAMNQYSDATQKINALNLSTRRNIDALMNNGQLTTAQAQQQGQEAQRRADQQLADLATSQSASTLSLQVLGAIRGNQVQALQTQSPFFNPQQVSPGSTLANAQGQSFFQGAGASPQTIMSTAQSLEQSAQQQGTLQYNTDGSVNHQFYLQQAQQYYQTGALSGSQNGAGGSAGGQAGTLSPQNFTQQSDGSYKTLRGYTINSNEAQKVAVMPGQFQTYVNGGPLGVAYVDGSQVAPAQENAVRTAAKNAGIPYLTAGEVTGIQAVDSIFQNLDLMKQYANVALGSGITGRLAGLTTNQVNSFFGTGKMVKDPSSGQMEPVGIVLKNFDQFKDNAAKAVTALAGGVGSGLRMNTSIIDAAVSNLPTSKDNVQQANAKVDAFARLVLNQYSTSFPSVKGQDPLGGNTQSGGSGTGGGSIWSF